MKAVVKTEPGYAKLALQDLPEPRPDLGQGVIEVSACGVCGTDIHHYDDEFPGAPVGTTVLAEPRGNREANSTHNLDLQLMKGFNIGGVRLVLVGSVLNATSVEEPKSLNDICEDASGCANPEGEGLVDLGDPIDWSFPRRYELGVRIEF